MAPNESSKPVGSTSELVLKVCLMVAIAVGMLIVVLAWVANRDIIKHTGFVITVVVLMLFLNLMVRAKGRFKSR